VIVGDKTHGATFTGNYDVYDSETAELIYGDAAKTQIK
jgi:hypothetical protein